MYVYKLRLEHSFNIVIRSHGIITQSVHACVRACVLACVRACMRACMRERDILFGRGSILYVSMYACARACVCACVTRWLTSTKKRIYSVRYWRRCNLFELNNKYSTILFNHHCRTILSSGADGAFLELSHVWSVIKIFASRWLLSCIPD